MNIGMQEPENPHADQLRMSDTDGWNALLSLELIRLSFSWGNQMAVFGGLMADRHG